MPAPNVSQLPGFVNVLFPKQPCVLSGVLEQDYYGVKIMLADACKMPDVVGTPQGKTFFETLLAIVGSPGADPINLADLQSIAAQIACDFYRYQINWHDVVFNGILNWAPEGISDCIEFTYNPNEITTRVTTGPINWAPENLLHMDWTQCSSSSSTSTSTIVIPTDVQCDGKNLMLYGRTATLEQKPDGTYRYKSLGGSVAIRSVGCCECPAKIFVTVNGCNFLGVPGLTVTLSGDSSQTGSTDSSGNVTFTVTNAYGTYTVSVAGGGYFVDQSYGPFTMSGSDRTVTIDLVPESNYCCLGPTLLLGLYAYPVPTTLSVSSTFFGSGTMTMTGGGSECTGATGTITWTFPGFDGTCPGCGCCCSSHTDTNPDLCNCCPNCQCTVTNNGDGTYTYTTTNQCPCSASTNSLNVSLGGSGVVEISNFQTYTVDHPNCGKGTTIFGPCACFCCGDGGLGPPSPCTYQCTGPGTGTGRNYVYHTTVISPPPAIVLQSEVITIGSACEIGPGGPWTDQVTITG